MSKLYSSEKWCLIVIVEYSLPKYRAEVRVAVIPHFPLTVESMKNSDPNREGNIVSSNDLDVVQDN